MLVINTVKNKLINAIMSGVPSPIRSFSIETVNGGILVNTFRIR